MNKIGQELEESKRYYLEQINKDLVCLSIDNVARIEAMIVNDSDYAQSSNIEVDSTAKWMGELRTFLMDKNSTYSFEYIIKNCVKYVDKENSTHLSSDGVGIDELTNRITSMKATLLDDLRNPQGNNYNIISVLSDKTHPKNKNGKKYNARRNYSFASKFCHYACFYLFEGQKEQDNFSIYDNIVAKNIIGYARYYGINMANYKDIDKDYPSYIKLVDAIIEKSQSNISRNGFDHLLWYFHKARK